MNRFGGYQPFLSDASRLRKLKGKDKKKYKREKFLRKITEDGKINKKEAKKMNKKGITERDLMRYDSKAFKRAEKLFNDRPGPVRDRRPGAEGPSYSPLTISRGAGKTFGDFKYPEPKAAAAPAAPAPYQPQDINKLIDDAIAKTTPPPLPEPPPAPQFVYSQPFLVPGQAQFGPSTLGIQRSNPFQRSGGTTALKINNTLNV
jgi:hypothetical protein